MKFENVLDEINGFGRFQITTVFLLCTPRLILTAHFLLNNFIGAVPPHHCDISSLDNGLFRNLTEEQKLTVSIPVGEDGSPKSCEMFAEPQFQLLVNGSNGTDLPTIPCQNGWVYDHSTFTSTIVTEWDLVCDRGSLKRTSSTIFFLGVMFGAIALGYLSDKYGRKITLFGSYVIALVFGFCSTFANSFIMFAVLRFFTGVGMTGLTINSVVLSVEWVDTKHRSLIGVAGGIGPAVGSMMLAGLAYLIRDWRTLVRVVTAPVGLALFTWWWIPESARWLLANGKVERAQFYLDKCAKFNKRPKVSNKVMMEMLSTMKTLENSNKNYTYLDLIKTPKLRHITLVTGIVWSGVAFTYYGISLNISGFGMNMYLTQFVYSLIDIPSKLVTYCLLNTIGRRWCQGGTLSLTGVCIAINIFVPKDLWYMRAIFAVIGKSLIGSAFTTVYLYTTELYPTVLRQNGMGYTSFMCRMGMSVAPLILLLENMWKPLPQIILSCMAITAGLLALLLPETKNVRLHETIDDIEKPRREGVASHSEESSGFLADLQGTTQKSSEKNGEAGTYAPCDSGLPRKFCCLHT